MFGLLKSVPHHHPELGQLQRLRGLWRGTVQVMTESVALVLSGPRKRPDSAAIVAACDLPSLLSELHPIVAQALFQHYEAGLDAYRLGELGTTGAPFPLISSPTSVWEHVTLVFIAITPIDGLMTTELGYETTWDIEHTLGARFIGNKFIELNGSVLPP